MIALILIVLVILLFYWQFVRPLNYWKERGIPYVPGYPVVGNFLKCSLKLESFCDTMVNLYNRDPDKSCLGIHLYMTPTLIIRSPELLKQITVKDFDHFTDHSDLFFNDTVDPIFEKNLFSLKGSKWHEMRTTLSPAFTGNKLRGMFSMIGECSDQLVEYCKEELKNTPNKILKVELKDLISRLTTDVIATTAFGVQVNSFENKNNTFHTMGQITTHFSSWRLLLVNLLPEVMKFIKFSCFSTASLGYFRKLAKDTITVREEKSIYRPDILQLLMEAKKGKIRGDEKEDSSDSFKHTNGTSKHQTEGKFKLLTNDDIAAQAYLFFFAGFDTVATICSFALYELALNPDIQNKLYVEIKTTLNQCEGKINYESILKMKYLDQVMSETLRKWPPLAIVDRICTKDYTLTLENNKTIVIEKGTGLGFALFGIHRDPKYFPDPNKFDPERFSDENKSKIQSYTYFPFGLGPRKCIASSFALLELKLAVFNILKHFEVVVTEKTTIPAVLDAAVGNPFVKNGFNVGFKLRNM